MRSPKRYENSTKLEFRNREPTAGTGDGGSSILASTIYSTTWPPHIPICIRIIPKDFAGACC